jgi:hypothetical protein
MIVRQWAPEWEAHVRTPQLRENETPGCPIQRVLENDFDVVTGTGTARDFIRLLTVELH